MKYENWKRLTARQKACWPAADKGYLDRQHKVTISLDADMAKWLVTNVVGRSSYTADLEETVITALRIARGELATGPIRPAQPQNCETVASSKSRKPGL